MAWRIEKQSNGRFAIFSTHPLTRGLEINASVENVFDRDDEVSATPGVTLGSPRALRIGLRYTM